jgi:hypothetical protein
VRHVPGRKRGRSTLSVKEACARRPRFRGQRLFERRMGRLHGLTVTTAPVRLGKNSTSALRGGYRQVRKDPAAPVR